MKPKIPYAHIWRAPGSSSSLCDMSIPSTEFAFDDITRAVHVYAHAGIPPRPCDSCLERAPANEIPPPKEWGGGR